jgi:hypothetical protein
MAMESSSVANALSDTFQTDLTEASQLVDEEMRERRKKRAVSLARSPLHHARARQTRSRARSHLRGI